MARTSTGRWVARAAATGGGRTYRGQVPTNWYAALVIIVLLGLASVIYSRYEYQHPHHGPPAVQPTVGQTWFAGFSFDVCGTQLSPSSLPVSTNASKVGLSAQADGVIQIKPLNASQAGNNANLGAFVNHYPGAFLSPTHLQAPGHPRLTNGKACPAGTPDAGKTGAVEVYYWKNTDPATKPVVVRGDPRRLKLGNYSLVTMGFVPPGTKLPAVPQVTRSAVVNAVASSATTTTTAPATTTTTGK